MKKILLFLFAVVLVSSCTSIKKKAMSTVIDTLKEQCYYSDVKFGEPTIVFENDTICLLRVLAESGKDKTHIDYVMGKMYGGLCEAFWDEEESGVIESYEGDIVTNMARHFEDNVREVGSGEKMRSLNFLGAKGEWKACMTDQLGEPLKRPYIYTECKGVCESDKYGNHEVTCKLIVESNESVSMQVFRNGRLDTMFNPRSANVKSIKGLDKNKYEFIQYFEREYIYVQDEGMQFCTPEELFGDVSFITMSVKSFDGDFFLLLKPYGYKNALKDIQ